MKDEVKRGELWAGRDVVARTEREDACEKRARKGRHTLDGMSE